MNAYIKTVKSLLAASKDKDALEVFKLQNITSYIYSHDNFNGGIDFYNIDISVPTSLYVKLKEQNKIDVIQNSINSAFNEVTRANESITVRQVLLIPQSDLDDDILNIVDDSQLWKAGYYKMFISHLTGNKDTASRLKTALLDYGITGFVAHEDITPTKEWQDEVEKALYTMDVLCAIIVPNFITSKWCDQELGFAMGRRKLIIPIKKEADPYGFVGKYQGIQSKGKKVSEVANEVFEALCKNEYSKAAYTKILADLFINSKNKSEAVKWINLLSSARDLDTSIIMYIHSNYSNNDNLNNKDVIQIANKLFAQYSMNDISVRQTIVDTYNRDDLPF